MPNEIGFTLEREHKLSLASCTEVQRELECKWLALKQRPNVYFDNSLVSC